MKKTILSVCLVVTGLWGQLTFEVATIKPSAPDLHSSGFQFLPGGGLKIQNVNLKEMISFAHDVRDFQVLGATGWIGSAPYDILAKPDSGQGPANLVGIPDKDREVVNRQIRERLRSLLAERFQLGIHKDTRELPMYGLVVAKNGLKLEESKDGDGSKQSIMRNVSNGKNVLTCNRVSMQMLTNTLSNILGRPVVDQTGLKVNYDLKMEWALDMGVEASSDITGPSIFTAIQEQLGLKLESQKGPVEVIVIDRAEKPSEN